MADFFSRNAALALPDDQLDEKIRACGTCGGGRLSPVLQVSDRPPVWMVQCGTCGIVSADRMPTPEFLDRYYSGYYDGPVPEGGAQVTVGAVQKLARHIFRHMDRDGTARDGTRRILDYGGGDGSVAVALAQLLLERSAERVEICVIDISETDLAPEDPRISLGIRDRIAERDTGSYDVVIASASLEHIRQPGPVIRQLLGCLNDTGLFYARTPFHLAMARLARRLGFAFNMGYPAHLHDIGAPFWDRVLETLDLSGRYRLIRSAPSVVSSTFASRFLRTLAAHAMKLPWHVLGNRYALVGGWEVVIVPQTTRRTDRP